MRVSTHRLSYLLLVFTIFSLGQPQYQSTYYFQNSPPQCYFILNYTDSTRGDFKFIMCNCMGAGEPIDNFGTVNSSDACVDNNQDYIRCTRYCCDPAVKYALDHHAIQQCQNYINQQYSISVVVGVFGFFGTIMFLVMCCWCCGCCDSCCPCCQQSRQALKNCSCCRRRGGSVSNANEQIVEKPASQLECTEENIKMEDCLNWKQSTTKGIQIQNDLCSICLSQSPNIQLSCSHLFHRLCIQSWCAKKRECSVCRSSDMSKIKVWCTHCRLKWKYTILDDNSCSDSCDQCQIKEVFE